MSRAILPALLTAILFPTEAGARRPPFGQSVFIGEVHNGAFPDHLHFGAQRGNRFVQAKLAIPRPVRTHPNQWLAGMHRVDDYANYGLDWAPDRRKVDFSLFFSGDPNFDGSGGNALFTWGSDHYRLGSGDVFPIYDELYLATIHATPVYYDVVVQGGENSGLVLRQGERPEHGVGPRRGKSTAGATARCRVPQYPAGFRFLKTVGALQRQRHRDAGRGRGPGDLGGGRGQIAAARGGGHSPAASARNLPHRATGWRKYRRTEGVSGNRERRGRSGDKAAGVQDIENRAAWANRSGEIGPRSAGGLDRDRPQANSSSGEGPRHDAGPARRAAGCARVAKSRLQMKENRCGLRGRFRPNHTRSAQPRSGSTQ